MAACDVQSGATLWDRLGKKNPEGSRKGTAQQEESGDSTLLQASVVRRKSEELQQKPRSLAEGIRSLRESASLCDILLVVGEETFPAHQAMLSAMAPALGAYLQEGANLDESSPLSRVVEDPSPAAPVATTPVQSESSGSLAPAAAEQKQEASSESTTPAAQAGSEAAANTAATGTTSADAPASNVIVPAELQPAAVEAAAEHRLKLRVNGVTNAESLKIVLDYIYQVGTGSPWEYNPSTLEVNKEVLQLAHHFELKHLHEYAARWLTKGLSTKNLVERLVICEEFKLGMLREKLIEQLTMNAAELLVVCRSAEVLAHPTILQDLLVQVSQLCGMAPHSSHRSSPQKREAPEEAVEEKGTDLQSKEEEKVAEKEKPEKTSTKAEKAATEKVSEEEKPEKPKAEKDKVEKSTVKVSTKVPPLKKKRTT